VRHDPGRRARLRDGLQRRDQRGLGLAQLPQLAGPGVAAAARKVTQHAACARGAQRGLGLGLFNSEPSMLQPAPAGVHPAPKTVLRMRFKGPACWQCASGCPARGQLIGRRQLFTGNALHAGRCTPVTSGAHAKAASLLYVLQQRCSGVRLPLSAILFVSTAPAQRVACSLRARLRAPRHAVAGRPARPIGASRAPVKAAAATVSSAGTAALQQTCAAQHRPLAVEAPADRRAAHGATSLQCTFIQVTGTTANTFSPAGALLSLGTLSICNTLSTSHAATSWQASCAVAWTRDAASHAAL